MSKELLVILYKGASLSLVFTFCRTGTMAFFCIHKKNKQTLSPSPWPTGCKTVTDQEGKMRNSHGALAHFFTNLGAVVQTCVPHSQHPIFLKIEVGIFRPTKILLNAFSNASSFQNWGLGQIREIFFPHLRDLISDCLNLGQQQKNYLRPIILWLV